MPTLGTGVSDTQLRVVHLQIYSCEPAQRIHASDRVSLGTNRPAVIGRPTPHGVVRVDVANFRQGCLRVADFELQRFTHGQVAIGLRQQVDQIGCSTASAWVPTSQNELHGLTGDELIYRGVTVLHQQRTCQSL